ncbi:MAG: hypothetical protein JNK04_15380 [Myxococcales bacterium]|nr:hypothetical protein [Myxococcales bacterium]
MPEAPPQASGYSSQKLLQPELKKARDETPIRASRDIVDMMHCPHRVRQADYPPRSQMMTRASATIRQCASLLLATTIYQNIGCGARTGLNLDDINAQSDGGAGGESPIPCPTSFADCHNSGSCTTDLNASPDNCGACGNLCPESLVCGAGTCRPPEDIIQVASGQAYTCALRASGEVLCWGGNYSGVLGDGSFEPHIAPMPVVGLGDAVEIEASTGQLDSAVMCARRATGTIACWGAANLGVFGTSSDEPSPVPVEVAGLTAAASIRVSQGAACALRQDGSVLCWGLNSSGQTGTKGSGTWAPAPVIELPYALQLDVGTFSCVTLATGEVACWGVDDFGWSGDSGFLEVPTIMKNVSDARAVFLPGPASKQVDGPNCVIHGSGAVSCTGLNESGNIDIDVEGDFINGEMHAIEGVSDAVQLAGTLATTCALRASGQVACWGSNAQGRLGIGSTEQPEENVVTVLGVEGALHIAGGWWHTCAALGSGGVACWGDNQAGQLGDGTTESRYSPVHVLGLP